jgi:uncharacterized membrane protein YbhN (UPF0104 family)
MRRLLENRTFLAVSALLGFSAFLAALFLFARHLPPEALARLSEARIVPLLSGFVLLAVAFPARAVRLNLLLPQQQRLSFIRGTMVSAAANVLYNTVPFRAGELVALALYRRETNGSWGQSTGLLVLIKAVDISTALAAGVTGALWLLAGTGTSIARSAALLFALAAAIALSLIPFLGHMVLGWVQPRLAPSSRLFRLARDLAEGLGIAQQRPAAYAASFVMGVLYLVLHLAGIRMVLEALGFPISIALVAAATVASVTAATMLPSPAGTFGSSEAGFASALAAAGIPIATGFVLASAVHLAIVATSCFLALPLLPSLTRKKDAK